jgi:putative sigma-54 modulation protein
MNLTFTGQHVAVTPAMKAHATSKLDRTSKRFEEVPMVHVMCRVEKHQSKEKQHQAEITMIVSGEELHAKAKHEDWYAAFNQAFRKLDGQAIAIKDRKKPRRDPMVREVQMT